MMMKCIIFCVRRGSWAGSITNKDPPQKENVEGDDDDGDGDDDDEGDDDYKELLSQLFHMLHLIKSKEVKRSHGWWRFGFHTYIITSKSFCSR